MNVRKTKLLRQGVSEGEEVILSNEKMGQVDIFAYLMVFLLVKTVGAVKVLKVLLRS